MARVYKITNGTDEVDLLKLDTPGIIPEGKGLLDTQLRIEHGFVSSGGAHGGGLGSVRFPLVAESVKLVVKGTSEDNLSSQIQTLVRLLRQAWRYHTNPSQTTPVYLQQQADGETNARYALIVGSPDISSPSFLTYRFSAEHIIGGLGLTIIREPFWRSHAPGSLPGSLLSLSESDGPSSPTWVHIANHRDTVALLTVRMWSEIGQSYGANYASSSSFTYFTYPPAVDCRVSIGCADPWHTVVLNIGTAAVYNATLTLQYWNGSSLQNLTEGTHYTIYPSTADLFKTAGELVINLNPPTDWATEDAGDGAAYLLHITITQLSSWSTSPTQADQLVYIQRSPHVAIPETSIDGDVPPLMLARLRTPAGGDENPKFSSTSRIIVGAKSRNLSTFVSHLNIGGEDNPAGWATVQGTDATATADVQAPGGKRSNITFAGDATLVVRATLTGTSKLTAWVGTYRAFIRAQQSGGAAGDVSLRLRVMLGGTATYDPRWDSELIDLKGVGQGLEVVDMGTLQLPFVEISTADTLSADLIFRVLAGRASGSAATLRLYDLILIPIDEWAAEFNDPVADAVSGSSALRGANLVEIDGGLLKNRTVKRMISGANLYPIETWDRRGAPVTVEPNVGLRLYFLMMHYPSGGTWGEDLLIGTLGMQLRAEFYAHFLWMLLRGADG